MVKGYFFLSFIVIASGFIAIISIQSSLFKNSTVQQEQKKALVQRLDLTDPSIWTEARYTRHPSQADLFSPFQDAPASFDHFPAGSIIAPPRFTNEEAP